LYLGAISRSLQWKQHVRRTWTLFYQRRLKSLTNKSHWEFQKLCWVHCQLLNIWGKGKKVVKLWGGKIYFSHSFIYITFCVVTHMLISTCVVILLFWMTPTGHTGVGRAYTKSRIRILCNYLPKFERIQASDCKKSLMGLTWSDKWLGSPIFIWSCGSHKWSLTITYPNSLKFRQIIVNDPNFKVAALHECI
jgi:hypothetical protein